jgi:single-strand DNA-binding protein
MLNKVQLIGNLGKDPEVRHLENGTAVARFSLATNERWKDKEGNLQEATEWHNIIAWRATAEFSEKYLKKGAKVYLEGKLQTRSWQPESGETRYTTEIVADRIVLLDPKPDGNRPPMPSEKDDIRAGKFLQPEVVVPMPDEKDDLPF